MISKLKNFFVVASAFFFFFILFYKPLEIEDNFWHLAAGRWIVTHQQFPRHDVFAFDSSLTIPWINLQWLGQILFYAIYALFSEQGLIVFRAMYFTGLLFIIFRRYCHKIPMGFLLTVLILLSYFLAQRCFLRPMIFNMFFSVLYLSWLFDYINGKKSFKYLLLIPLTGIVWYNTNGGAFVYGGLICAIFTFHAGIQWLRMVSSQEQKRQFFQLFFISALFLASFLINPYGWQGVAYYFLNILDPQAVRHLVCLYVQEEHFDSSYFFHPPVWFLLTLGLSAWATWRTKQANQFLYIILLLGAFVLFIYKSRAVDFLSIVCVFIICESFVSRPPKEWNAASKTLMLSIVTVFCLYQSYALSAQTAILREGGRPFRSLRLYPYPEFDDVVSFIKKSGIEGNIFNTEGLGGYFLWDGYPRLRPVKDGRNLNDHLLNFSVRNNTHHGLWYPKLLFSPETFWGPFTDHYQVNSAVLVYFKGTKQLANYLNGHPQWELVFLKGRFMVFVKKGVYKISSEFESEKKRPIPAGSLHKLKRLIKEKSRFSITNIFFPSVVYGQELAEGITLVNLGYKAAAMEKFLSYFSHSDTRSFDPIFVKNLIKAFEK